MDSPSEPPEGTNSADNLILNFQPPELRKKQISVVLNHPVYDNLSQQLQETNTGGSPKGGGGVNKEAQGNLGEGWITFIFYIAVMVSQMYNMSKLKLYTLNMHSLLYVTYTSIKVI